MGAIYEGYLISIWSTEVGKFLIVWRTFSSANYREFNLHLILCWEWLNSYGKCLV